MRKTLTPLAAALLAASLPAQIYRYIPVSAPLGDSNYTSAYPFGYTTGRTQQILAGSAFCKATAVIREIAFRGDAGTTDPGRTISQLKFTAGYAAKTPSTMSTTFAQNRSGTPVVIFSGKFLLPPLTGASRPFNIVFKFPSPFVYLRTKGDFYFEFEIPGTPGKSNYFLDAHKHSGLASTTLFGTQGPFKSGDLLKPSCPNLPGLTPGGKADYLIQGMKGQYPAVVMWGFSITKFGPITLPLDLKGLGAPNNWLYVSPDLMLPLPVTAVGTGWEGRSSLPIPNDPAFKGFSIHLQSAFVHSASNAFGLVFSQALTMNFAGGPPQMALVGHYDSTKAVGFSPRAGVVVRLGGVFQ